MVIGHKIKLKRKTVSNSGSGGLLLWPLGDGAQAPERNGAPVQASLPHEPTPAATKPMWHEKGGWAWGWGHIWPPAQQEGIAAHRLSSGLETPSLPSRRGSPRALRAGTFPPARATHPLPRTACTCSEGPSPHDRDCSQMAPSSGKDQLLRPARNHRFPTSHPTHLPPKEVGHPSRRGRHMGSGTETGCAAVSADIPSPGTGQGEEWEGWAGGRWRCWGRGGVSPCLSTSLPGTISYFSHVTILGLLRENPGLQLWLHVRPAWGSFNCYKC